MPDPFFSLFRGFDDFDELTELLRQWDLDLLQIDQGRFHGELAQLGSKQALVSVAKFGRSFVQKGSPPPGLRTIGVPANKDICFSWRGQQVTGSDLVIFPPGAELFSVSSPDFHVFTCSFPEQLLGKLAVEMSIDELDCLRGDRTVLRCDLTALESVRRCIRKLCVEAQYSLSSANSPMLVRQIENVLPKLLLSTIANSDLAKASRISRKREGAIMRVLSLIENSGHQLIETSEIYRTAQVSQRTLEYAFEERFGTSPISYLKMHRLNAVRREIRYSDSNQLISKIADKWGFWHMGQFAADYRKMFGELPSQTSRIDAK